jgi:hypothetical protein
MWTIIQVVTPAEHKMHQRQLISFPCKQNLNFCNKYKDAEKLTQVDQASCVLDMESLKEDETAIRH